MKEIKLTKTGHDLAQLADELFAAFPAWRRPALNPLVPGAQETDVQIRSEGETLILLVPEGDEQSVRSIVAAHTPKPKQPPADLDALLDAVEDAATVKELAKTIAAYERAKHPDRRRKAKSIKIS